MDRDRKEDDLYSQLRPKDDLEEIDYNQRFRAAGYRQFEPTLNDALKAAPRAEQPVIIEREIKYKEVFKRKSGDSSVITCLITALIITGLWVWVFVRIAIWFVQNFGH